MLRVYSAMCQGKAALRGSSCFASGNRQGNGARGVLLDRVYSFRIQPLDWRGHMNVSVNESMVTTTFDLPGYSVAKSLGLVRRGVTVRSRSVLGALGASLQTIIGGNITLFEQMCEKAREQALELMMEHALE